MDQTGGEYFAGLGLTGANQFFANAIHNRIYALFKVKGHKSGVMLYPGKMLFVFSGTHARSFFK